MLLGTRLECIESSPRVSEAWWGFARSLPKEIGSFQDDAREFTKRRPRLIGRFMMDFSELSINVLLLRWSKANQELSLELSPRRDSVISLVQIIPLDRVSFKLNGGDLYLGFLWRMAGGEEEAAAGGHGKDSDGRQEEEAAAGGRVEDSDCRREEAVGASTFGAATAAEVGDSGREAREEGSAGG
ncbi:hypothetical protein GW17_00047493 [Ensete ventricosum]|nr:hypothetical protein GW17_00047493 [Ensete ventricosum]